VPELPAGTVTFVFTDIEDSTELLKRLGDDYRDLLTGHRRIVRDSFTARGGVEMDTQGDAFFFVFARARDALAAAVDAQRAHAAAEWPADASVRVRIGLHTGEPAIHEEGYVGLDVVRAARICTVGRGGQVLLSETTRALIGSGLPEGVTVFPLGQRHLRGIDEPERVYEVAIDGIEREEVQPTARTASATRTTAASSDEFGREISQRLEGLGARLAAGIQERVLHALEGRTDSAGSAERGATGSVDEIASRVASLGDEIDARVRAALAGKAKGSGKA
jgi:class 3 adenylate cyclase